MARVTVAERARLSVLIGGRMLRTAYTQLSSNPLMRWRFSPRKTDRLVIAPQDLRTADATRAHEIYAGRFAFAGKVVICDRRSPFEMTPPTDEWAVMLFGFSWLRHLRAADSAITRANARALVDDWISLQGTGRGVAWRPDVISRRVMSWLSQTPLLLADSDARFYRRFLRSLTRQVRVLRRTANETRDGLPRLQAVMALTCATLCMAGEMRHLNGVVRRLSNELDRQILPDGGHVSRNPGVLIELLLDMLPLRQAFAARNLPSPASLNNAIDRIMPMLRFFRHGDGNFAHFNGMGPTAPDLLATVLAYDDARGAPVANAPHSGYQRMDAAEAVVLVDAGRPPPVGLSQDAHAGCLSFEFSWRQQRLVLNCGLPLVGRENWRQVTRATAAHSTVTVNDSSSCRFLENGSLKKLLFGIPIVSGPRDIKIARDDTEDGIALNLAHDGYADSFGIIHQRQLKLSSDGHTLEGEDMFTPAYGDEFPQKSADEFAIRFHLHPSIKANRLSDGHGAILVMPDRDVWTFNAYGDPVEIEESVYLAGSEGPRRTAQIVIYGRARAQPRVQWAFLHVPPPQSGKAARSDEPELPL